MPPENCILAAPGLAVLSLFNTENKDEANNFSKMTYW